MPNINGFEVLTKIKQLNKKVRIVLMSDHFNNYETAFLIDYGINGIMHKNINIEELQTTINIVNKGGTYISSELNRNIKTNYQYKYYSEINTFCFSSLTIREKEIVKLICEQLTSKEIASRLFISELTVNNHKAKIMKKLNVKSSIGIAIYAIKSQLY